VLGRFIAVDSQAPPKISIDHSRDSGDTPGNRKLLFLCRLSVRRPLIQGHLSQTDVVRTTLSARCSALRGSRRCRAAPTAAPNASHQARR
jgi:hypothetical protein